MNQIVYRKKIILPVDWHEIDRRKLIMAEKQW